jgi:very-short-patch-repair endonuclease
MVYLGKTRVKDMFVGAKPDLFIFAREMRKNPTESEKLLWEHLKKIRSEGFIFRRQHPVDIFIADFYCHKIKLAIEIDGGVHECEQAQKYDDGRTGELERYGIKVIRFKNEEVLNNIKLVMNKIQSTIMELASPSLPGRGGQEGVR